VSEVSEAVVSAERDGSSVTTSVEIHRGVCRAKGRDRRTTISPRHAGMPQDLGKSDRTRHSSGGFDQFT
jgi:hypothetical protein